MGRVYLLVAALLSIAKAGSGFSFQSRGIQTANVARPKRCVASLRARRYESYTDEIRHANSASALRAVLGRMLERNTPPEVLHYNAAMSRARQLQDPKLAATLFDELLKDRTLSPDVYSFSAAIRAADRDWRRALSLLDVMAREYGCTPDVVCFTAAVTACSRAGQTAQALALYERMFVSKVEPNAFTYSALVSACDKAGRAEDALRLVAASRAAGLEPPPFVWASAISACGKAGKPDLALATLKDYRLGADSAVNDGATAPFNAALSACARAGRASAALDLLNGLRRAPLGTGGLAPEASSLAEYGTGNWPRADVISYNACLGALVQGQHHSLAVSLFQELDGTLVDASSPSSSSPPGTNGIKPDAVSFQLGLAAMAGAGDGDGALALLGRMERQAGGAPLPDSHAYSALVRAATTAGNSALAMEAKNRARAFSAISGGNGGGLSTTAGGGQAQQWVCPSCGWRNRPQNNFCGGNNNQVNGASGPPAYGCGKPRPAAAQENGAAAAATAGPTLPKSASGTTPGAFREEDLLAEPGARAPSTIDYDAIEEETGEEGADEDVDDAMSDFDESVWTISEGQAVEVWDSGRLIMGNVVLSPPPAASTKNQQAAGANTLHVLVFDPSAHLVGGAKDDDLDEHNAAGRAKVASKSSAVDATRVVKRFALDQVVSAWDLMATDNEGLRDADASAATTPSPFSAIGASAHYYPYSAAEWSRCMRDASVLAQQLPARRGSPEEVWQASKKADAMLQAALKKNKKKLAQQKQQTGKEPVGIPEEGAASTVKVAQYLLDGEFYEGTKGRYDLAAQASRLLSEGDPSGLVRVRAAAHWHAASLLGASQFHFKRVVAAPAAAEENGDVPSALVETAAVVSEEEIEEPTAPQKEEEDVPALESLLGQGADPKAIAQMRAMLGSLNGADSDKDGKSGKNGRGQSSSKSNPMSGDNNEVTTEMAEEEVPALRVTGGGWRPLAPSVVVSREALHFAKTIQAKRAPKTASATAASAPAASEDSNYDLSSSWSQASVRRIADQLELLALGGGPVLLGPEAKAALQALQQQPPQTKSSSSSSQGGKSKSFTTEGEATPEVAQQILLDLGHWTSKPALQPGAAGTASSINSEAAEPWSSEALNHAAVAAEAIASRRRRLANMAPNPVVGDSSHVPLSAGFRFAGAEDLVPGSSDVPAFAAATALAERGARGNSAKNADDGSSEVAWLDGWPLEWRVGPHGRVDLRGDDRMPAVCVDLTTKGLKDDAFSWHAPTRTLLVHSTAALANAALLNPATSTGTKDSQSSGGHNPLSLGGALDLLARRRGEAAYFPGGTLLLLPANLLNIASLASGFEAPLLGQGKDKDDNKKAPAVGVPTANECLTVAFRFAGGEGDSSGLPAGALVGAWMFESVIGPVQSLTFDSADAALTAITNTAAAAQSAQTKEPSPSSIPGPTPAGSSLSTDSAADFKSYAGAAARMTVAELRAQLAAKGLPKTGLKAVLVERWAQAQVTASATAEGATNNAANGAAASSGSSISGSRQEVESALVNAAIMRDPSLATVGAVTAAQPWLINTLSRYYTGTQRKKPAVLTRNLHSGGGTSSSSSGSGSGSSNGGVVGSSASSVSLDLCLRLFSEEATRITKKRGVFAPRLADAAATRFATAPLRRYVDGLAQRQLLSLTRGTPPPLAPNVVRKLLGSVGARKGAVTKAKTFIKASTGGASRPGASQDDDDDYEDEDEDEDEDGGNSLGSLLGLAAACAAQTAESKLAYAVLPAVASGNGLEVEITFEQPDNGGERSARGQEGSSSSSVRAVLSSAGAAGRGFKRGARLTVRIVSVDLQRQKVYAQLNEP